MARKITFFEKILFIVGIAVTLLGFYLINQMFISGGKIMSFEMLTVVFLWFLLIFQIVIVAISENQKEDAFIMNKELHEETRLMRQIAKDNLIEIKLLRADLTEFNKFENNSKKKSKFLTKYLKCVA